MGFKFVKNFLKIKKEILLQKKQNDKKFIFN